MKNISAIFAHPLFKVLPVIMAVVLISSCRTAPDTIPATPSEVENPVSMFSEIIGKEWKLTEIRSSPDIAASRFSRQELAEIGMENVYTLRFDEERLGGMAAPNRYFAPYKQEGQELSIEKVAGTLMASFREPESLKEREYFTFLETVNKWDLAQDKLQLYTRNEQGAEIVLIFEAE